MSPAISLVQKVPSTTISAGCFRFIDVVLAYWAETWAIINGVTHLRVRHGILATLQCTLLALLIALVSNSYVDRNSTKNAAIKHRTLRLCSAIAPDDIEGKTGGKSFFDPSRPHAPPVSSSLELMGR